MYFKSHSGQLYRYSSSENKIFRVWRLISENRPSKTADFKVVLPFDEKSLREILDGHVPFMSISLTDQCNMRCKYCIYSGAFASHRSHGTRVLSLERGRKAIDWFERHSRKEKQVRIGFWGGEVLLTFDLLKQLVEYAKERFGERLGGVYFTTNGTVMSPMVINWIRDCLQIEISITLNGPREIHDRERVFIASQGTHKIICTNIQKLYECLGPEAFRRRVHFLANYRTSRERFELIAYFKENSVFNGCKIQYVKIEQPNESYEENPYNQQRLKLLDEGGLKSEKEFYEAGFSPERLFLLHERNNFCGKLCFFHGGCVPFANRVLVDMDGKIRLCESTETLPPIASIDSDQHDGRMVALFNELETTLNTRLKCPKCDAVHYCTMCFKDFLCADGIRPVSQIKARCRFELSVFKNELMDYVSILEKSPEILEAFHGASISKDVFERLNMVMERKLAEKGAAET